jgi:hypothetical protein
MTGNKDSSNFICRCYGCEWVKSDIMSAKAKKGIKIDVCQRDDCEQARRRYVG